jgi:ATP-dependent Clp protease adaptor protein ClpS
MSGRWEAEGELVTEQAPRTQEKLEKPRFFRVLLHNDHYTTREFVVEVLQLYFHKSEAEATQIMLQVHHQGMGVAGVYTHEVAETKIRQVELLAREYEYPLRLSMEPHDE